MRAAGVLLGGDGESVGLRRCKVQGARCGVGGSGHQGTMQLVPSPVMRLLTQAPFLASLTPLLTPTQTALLSHTQNITDEDVLALVNDEVHQPTVVWVLEDLQVPILGCVV